MEIFTIKEISMLQDLLNQEKINIFQDTAIIEQRLRVINSPNEASQNVNVLRSKLLMLREAINTIRDIEGKLSL